MRVQYKDYGVRLNLFDFETEELISSINEVMASNSTQRKNIERASMIYRSQPLIGKDLAGYWVDHILKFGGKHFRSQAFEIPTYQFLLMDVLLFLVVIILLVLFVLYVCLRVICRKVFSTRMEMNQKEKEN